MNIDIVNPIPPRIATENNMLHEIFWGNVQILIFTARNASKKMPIGLPISRPKNIPNEQGCVKEFNVSELIVMLVLAKAKMGKIKKATGQ